MNPSHSILVPIDLDKPANSNDALQFVHKMAAEMPVDVTLLYVINLNVFPPLSRVYEEMYSASEMALRELAAIFFHHGQIVNFSVRRGKAHEQIVAEAADKNCDLILLSSPRPSRWGRYFASGTAMHVLDNAPCPALTLPASWKPDLDIIAPHQGAKIHVK